MAPFNVLDCYNFLKEHITLVFMVCDDVDSMFQNIGNHLCGVITHIMLWIFTTLKTLNAKCPNRLMHLWDTLSLRVIDLG
jgi:hypothetical protein